MTKKSDTLKQNKVATTKQKPKSLVSEKRPEGEFKALRQKKHLLKNRVKSNKLDVISESRNVHSIRFGKVTAGWKQWIMVASDIHIDNKKCNRTLLKQHLELAKERKALIFVFGDLFCAMQGKYDPRKNMEDIRPEDVHANYLDKIIEHAAEFLAPYAQQFVVLGYGNHETSILDRHNISLLDRLVTLLNQSGGDVRVGGFGGWIRFMASPRGTAGESIKLRYFHGSGGGSAPVTRGVIDTSRQAVYLDGANIVCNGHNHEAYHVPITTEGLSNHGQQKRGLMHFLRTPGYKDDWNKGVGGWSVEKGHPPKPMGCAWILLACERTQMRRDGIGLALGNELTVRIELHIE